jgi:type IV secretory pathway protease TraF
VVLIDETVDAIDKTRKAEGRPPSIDGERLIAQSWELLAPNETGTGFAKRYFEALQRDPDVVLAHARMRKILSSLG